MAAETTGRKQRGRPFKPGESGNPAGRPRGSGLSGKLREAIAKDTPQILATLAQQARDGDVQAARLLLDRVLPPLRAESAAVELPAMQDAETHTERAQAALEAAAGGRIPPDVAASLVAAAAQLAKLAELDDMEARIRALENR